MEGVNSKIFNNSMIYRKSQDVWKRKELLVNGEEQCSITIRDITQEIKTTIELGGHYPNINSFFLHRK